MGLGPIEEDVRFDHGAAQRLITLCNSAAGTIEGQAGSRASWTATAQAEFRGYFSELFARNQETARNDADEIARRLREVARFTGDLADEAREEQQRREQAREWKREQEDRNLLEKGWDWLSDGNDAPVPNMPEPSNFQASVIPPRPRETPRPGSGGGSAGGGTSSARPSDLRTFANGSSGANSSISGKPTNCRTAYQSFIDGCHWGGLEAASVFSGFTQYVDANEEDVLWARTVAAAFEEAGGSGNVSTLSNSALTAALQARGIDASRQDIVVDPPTAYGNPPTSGYADDPVNAATGNFIENETDLSCPGGTSSLVLTRTYNSFDPGIGAFGPGWSSWTEAGLVLDDEAARMRLHDGRVVVFPRLGDGWDRASGENLWLERRGTSVVASTNDGTRWTFDGSRLVEHRTGEGTGVALVHDEQGRLVRLEHERGRSITLTWDDGLERVVAAVDSAGREATYDYDEAGQLVSVTTPAGTRTYRWDEQGLVAAVVDADGVLEAENSYDERRRVTSQCSRHGRISRFVYLQGNVTVVSDPEGSRSNTWISDHRGRLIGVVDSEERRQSFAYDAHGNRVMVTDRGGATTVREYDARGRMVREVSPSGADLTYGYDEADRVTTVVTEDGAVVEYSYEGEQRDPSVVVDPEGGRTEMTWTGGLLTRVVDPAGVTLDLAYDDHGDLVATTDALGHTARLERDAHGRVVAAVSPLGHRTTFTYSPAGRMTSRRDPEGGVWRFEHTTAGRLSATVDPTGARTEVERDEAGEEVRSIDPLGRAVVRRLDDLGNLAAVELPDGSTWRFAHDALSRLVSTTDPDGSTWSHEHDATGTVVATVDPTGVRRSVDTDLPTRTVTVGDGATSVATSHDSLGRPVRTDAADGSAVVSTYDRCGRVVEQLDAEGGLTRTERDAAGRPVAVTSPAGHTTRYEHDARGRLAAVVDATGARTTYEHDADGRLVSVTQPSGEVARNEHDGCGRIVAAHRPGRGVARYRYDAAGRLVESSDTWHGHRRYRYDAAGQLVEAVNGNGGTTRFDHDANGRRVALTDPLGHTTRRVYDACNRLVSETDPLGRTTRAGHDAAGRLTSYEDPTGRRVEWTLDDAGRVVAVVVDGRTVSEMGHDARRRLTVVTDHTREGRTETVELERNRRGQLVRRTRGERSVLWTYDADGRRTSMTAPDGTTTTYVHDAAGRFTEVDHPLLGRAVLTRDAAGHLVEVTSGALVQTWTREGDTVTHAAGEHVTEVRRDEQGRVVELVRDGRRTTYEHDAGGQLAEARTDGSVHRWRYDAAGRLVGEVVDGVAVEHAYDAAGQLTRSTGPDGTTTYEHDGLGRRVRQESPAGTRELEWSATGWLAAVTDRSADGGVERLDLHVDATGRLVEAGGVTIDWDAAAWSPTPVQVGDVPVVAAGPLTGVGDAWSTPGWRTGRATGSDPWGATGGTGQVPLPGGLVLGADGGLVVAGLEWLGARVMDPASRGFLSVDPLDPALAAAWAGNPYSYAGNDPLHALDPLGLEPLTDQELQAYNAANNTGFAAAGEWVSNNWEYLVAGAAIVVGGALIFTGVGGPLGGMLIGGGIDLALQKATLGPGESIRWDQVAVNTVLGAVPGAGSLAGRIPGVSSAAARTVVGNGITGAGTGFAGGTYSYFTDGDKEPHTVGGWLSSASVDTAIGMGAGGLQGVTEVGGIRHAFRSADLVDAPVTPNYVGNPGDELVIGQRPDVEVANGWDGHHVPGTQLDDHAVQQAIDYQRPVYLASEPGTGFSAPMQELQDAGYTRQGDYMVPPGTPGG